jgi:hypothetical protein
MKYACLALLGFGLPLAAAEPAPTRLLFEPSAKIALSGRDATRQLVVSAIYPDDRKRDVTRNVQFEVRPATVASIDPLGFLTPKQEGEATITARLGTVTAVIALNVSNLIQDTPVHFVNQVVPIFTKHGCNAGGCHGKADGQNGFKLSLLGFEPSDDYEYLVKEARGRRLFASAPDHSLLLRKAIGVSPHGGGKKLDAASPFYSTLKRWIEQGAPYGASQGGEVKSIQVLPPERLLDRGSSQQLVVLAQHADGTVSDVTRMTQFETNVEEIATVSGTGLVSTKSVPGTAAIMVRYQSHVDVFRATVPLGAKIEHLPPAKSFIDQLVFQRLQQLGLPPSELCDDPTFLRRATIDLTGRLPTRAEAEAFAKNSSPGKRAELVDALLASVDHADYFAMKWGNVLRNRRRSEKDDPKPTAAFRDWLKQAIQANKPYDVFVREVLTATGEEIQTPPVIWYRELKDPSAAMEDAAQLFLGQRLGCAKCHHHPFEKWSQHDYWSMTAFFSRLDYKEMKPGKKNKEGVLEGAEPGRLTLKPNLPEVKNPRTNKPVKPAGLDSEPMTLDRDEDPRGKLAEWMTNPKNPFFAKSLVNRYWKHFLGRGLIDPEDDMRVTNPPTNPELLEALAKSFVVSKYDLKKLIRTICTSTTYQLSAIPNAHNAEDRQNYSRFLPKRLHAEVLLDAIDEVTLARTKFKNAPASVTRAVQLPDNLVDSYFLSVFGRPDSASACECERSGDASLAQALHMFNSDEVLKKVAGPRAAALGKEKRPHEERISELYLTALSRKPTPEELATLTGYINKKGNDQTAYEDIIWALINTKEFLFNH